MVFNYEGAVVISYIGYHLGVCEYASGSSESAVPAIIQVCIVDWIAQLDKLDSVSSVKHIRQVGSVRECLSSLRQEWVAWLKMLAVDFRDLVVCMQLLMMC